MKTQILTLTLAAAMTALLTVPTYAADKVAPPTEIAAPINVTVADASAENFGNVLLKVSYDKDEALQSFVEACNDGIADATEVELYAQIDWSLDAADDWKYQECWDANTSVAGEYALFTPNWEYIYAPAVGNTTESVNIFDIGPEFEVWQMSESIIDIIDPSVYTAEWDDEKGYTVVTVDWAQHSMNVRVRYLLKYYPAGTTFEMVPAPEGVMADFVQVSSNDPIIVLSPWSEVVSLNAEADVGAGETPTPVDPVPVEPITHEFSDVPAEAYYAAPVSWAFSNGITKGTTETTFAPDEVCTRAQILTFLWRLAGCPEASAEMTFTDVVESEYYVPAVRWAIEKGIIEAGEAFAPDTACTRGDIVDFMWKYAGSPASDTVPTFTDVTTDSADYNAVAWATDAGITDGMTETTFSADESYKRGEVITFIWRAFAE